MRTLEPLESRRMLDAGQIDATFADAGSTHVDFSAVVTPGYNPAVHGFAEDRNGYLYFVGKDFENVHFSSADLLIARLTPQGQLDPHFGNAGIVVMPLQDFDTQLIVVDRQSRTYVSDGTRLYRLTTTGRFDKTFGHAGKMTIPKVLAVHSMQVDDDAHVYVAGSDQELNASNNQSIVVRLTETGRLDGSWATRGVFTVPSPSAANPIYEDSLGAQMQILSDNRLLVAAEESYRSVPNDPTEDGEFVHQVLATRLNFDGSIDSSYGDGGTKLISQRDTLVQFFIINIDRIISDGSVIVDKSWGFDTDQVEGGREIRRISANGKSSPPYVESPTDVSLHGGAGSAIAYQRDGKLIGGNGTEWYRLNVDGTLDRTFGRGGVIESTFRGSSSILSDGSFFRFGSESSSKYWTGDSPVAQLVAANDLTESRDGALSVRVNWRDDDGIDPSSITSGDIYVQRPDGTRRSLRLASVAQIGAGVSQAIYKLTDDDGSWNAADSGTYEIHTRSRRVVDINGVRNASAFLGKFEVTIH